MFKLVLVLLALLLTSHQLSLVQNSPLPEEATETPSSSSSSTSSSSPEEVPSSNESTTPAKNLGHYEGYDGEDDDEPAQSSTSATSTKSTGDDVDYDLLAGDKKAEQGELQNSLLTTTTTPQSSAISPSTPASSTTSKPAGMYVRMSMIWAQMANSSKNSTPPPLKTPELVTMPPPNEARSKDPELSSLSSAQIAEIERVDIPQADGTIAPPALKSVADTSADEADDDDAIVTITVASAQPPYAQKEDEAEEEPDSSSSSPEGKATGEEESGGGDSNNEDDQDEDGDADEEEQRESGSVVTEHSHIVLENAKE